MLVCPSCKSPLKKASTKAGLFWICPLCNGRAVAIEVLRKVVPRPSVNQLWLRARSGEYPRKRHCPACTRLMTEVPLITDGSDKYIDVCKGCHFIWFDPGEFKTLPKIKIEQPKEKVMSMAERELLARAEIQKYELQLKEDEDAGKPEHWWQYIPAIFGVPIEQDNPQLTHMPLATWALAAVIAIISIWSFSNLEEVIDKWGLIPASASRHFGFTFISSFFLHADYVHLIGNLAFLLMFGDNTEDVLGPFRFLILIAIASIVGGIAHVIGDPRTTIACVGASGGISGVLAYYCLRFPNARIGVMLWYRWFCFRAGIMLAVWIMFQIYLATTQVMGFENTSALAHLGGTFVGIIFYLFTRPSINETISAPLDLPLIQKKN